MAGKITSLEVQKRNKERVNIYIEGEYALAVTMPAALGLKKGQFLSDAEIERLEEQDQRSKAYHHALFYLGFRSRSGAEIERYLRDKKYTPEVIDETVTRLQQEGYIDDSAFAQMWVENRERLNPKSARALRYELKQKGVGNQAIDAALSELDEPELARRALEKKVRQWTGLEEMQFRKKAMGFLSRRGFGYGVIREVVDQAWESVQPDAEN